MSLIIIQGILSFFKYEEIILGRAFKWEKKETEHGWQTSNQYIYSLTFLFLLPVTYPLIFPSLCPFPFLFLPSPISVEQTLSDQCRKESQVVLGKADAHGCWEPWLLREADRKVVWGENGISCVLATSQEVSLLGYSWNRFGTSIQEEIGGQGYQEALYRWDEG